MTQSFSTNRLSEISVSFNLRTSYKNTNGECPIVVRLKYRGDQADVNTGLGVDKKFWISGNGVVSTKCKAGATINQELDRIRFKILQLFEQMQKNLGDFYLKELVNRLRGKDDQPETLMEYAKRKQDQLEKRLNIDLSLPTLYKYKRTVRYLQEFIDSKESSGNIPAGRVNGEFLEDFMRFLRSTKANSQNSASALMTCLKSILEEPVKNGLIRYNPFKEIQLKRKPVQREFLTKEEIIAVQSLVDLAEHHSRSRDIFLFACFTGLAYSDIKSFSRKNITIDPDGSKHLQVHRTKTGVASYIPLIPAAEKILLKYSTTGNCKDFQWKVPCNQKLNSYLKVIAKAAGIDRNVFMHLARHTFATTVTLSQGISIEAVSKMLGHTTLKHTQLYAKIVNSKVKAEMEKVRNSFGDF